MVTTSNRNTYNIHGIWCQLIYPKCSRFADSESKAIEFWQAGSLSPDPTTALLPWEQRRKTRALALTTWLRGSLKGNTTSKVSHSPGNSSYPSKHWNVYLRHTPVNHPNLGWVRCENKTHFSKAVPGSSISRGPTRWWMFKTTAEHGWIFFKKTIFAAEACSVWARKKAIGGKPWTKQGLELIV